MAVGNDPEVAERVGLDPFHSRDWNATSPPYRLGFSPEDWPWRTRPAQRDIQSERAVETQPPNRQPADKRGESLCHSLRSVRKTPATSISIMRTMARVTPLSLFTDIH